jgi:hypothetical protein
VDLVDEAAVTGGGGSHPWAAHRDPPATEAHLAALGAVAVRGPVGIVFALRPGDVGHLGLDQLTHDIEANCHRGGEQSLVHATGEQLELLVQLSCQPFLEARIAQVDETELWHEPRAAHDRRLGV